MKKKPEVPPPQPPRRVKSSGFALLDVSTGRGRLKKYLEANPGAKIPVVIQAYVTRPWGLDDGTSIEFELEVEDVLFRHGKHRRSKRNIPSPIP